MYMDGYIEVGMKHKDFVLHINAQQRAFTIEKGLSK